MKKHLMFELSITDSLKIRVYEDKDYETLYEDSHIYLVYNEKEKKILEHSFADQSGLQMYQRLYNINDYDEKIEIDKYLEDNLNICNNIENFDAYVQSKQSAIDIYNYNKYVFVHCIHDYVLLLYKKSRKYFFSIVKHTQHKTKKTYKSKLLCTYELSEEQIIDWKEKITNEFPIRAKKESERISKKKISDEKWNKWLEHIKDEKGYYFKS